MRKAIKITLDEVERNQLIKINQSRNTPARLIERGRIVLLASEGKENLAIAKELGIARQTAGI